MSDNNFHTVCVKVLISCSMVAFVLLIYMEHCIWKQKPVTRGYMPKKLLFLMVSSSSGDCWKRNLGFFLLLNFREFLSR